MVASARRGSSSSAARTGERPSRRRWRLIGPSNRTAVPARALRQAMRFATRPVRPGHGPTRVPPGTVLELGIIPGNTVATSRRTPTCSATLWAATWVGWVTTRSAPVMTSWRSLVSSSIWSNTNRPNTWRRPKGTRRKISGCWRNSSKPSRRPTPTNRTSASATASSQAGEATTRTSWPRAINARPSPTNGNRSPHEPIVTSVMPATPPSLAHHSQRTRNARTQPAHMVGMRVPMPSFTARRERWRPTSAAGRPTPVCQLARRGVGAVDGPAQSFSRVLSASASRAASARSSVAAAAMRCAALGSYSSP
jgi:hypothetical protein